LKDDILEAEGFRVSTMLRRDTGVSEIVAMKPDLLVMDYVPPEESSLLQDAATDPRTRQIPILLCSGAIREVEAIMPELDALGVTVIFKPFDIDDLIAVVHEAMGLPVDSDESKDDCFTGAG
jgi:DNA-binding response OmpR family regulator